ncbi:unnamed protein product [Gadus morhua 'NCC']
MHPAALKGEGPTLLWSPPVGGAWSLQTLSRSRVPGNPQLGAPQPGAAPGSLGTLRSPAMVGMGGAGEPRSPPYFCLNPADPTTITNSTSTSTTPSTTISNTTNTTTTITMIPCSIIGWCFGGRNDASSPGANPVQDWEPVPHRQMCAGNMARGSTHVQRIQLMGQMFAQCATPFKAALVPHPNVCPAPWSPGAPSPRLSCPVEPWCPIPTSVLPRRALDADYRQGECNYDELKVRTNVQAEPSSGQVVDPEQTTGENPLVALTAFRLFLHNFVSLHPSVDITVIALCSRSPQRVTMAPTDGTLPRSCPLIGGERVLSGEQLINTQPDCQPDINFWNESLKGPTLGPDTAPTPSRIQCSEHPRSDAGPPPRPAALPLEQQVRQGRDPLDL